ncbi:hypothetical protein INT46_002212 [Mucor plumbeus]|uniref:PiggyBac transposable element-derived protein domain-containing protein n=1 Tax=Mucor plumbeus TaxID=97098 RepID=A0A8H7QMB9_9FUNG|nr:hypothetical protein INT46_002212 [Mucor plumbeus]
MSYKRFDDIMHIHVFEIYSFEKQQLDPLYQVRSTIEAFNDHMAKCLIPGKYLVIDQSMNQWLGTGMPNLKKKQEFKTLADHHTFCILQMDTVSDPKPKEYDDDPGMRKLTATIKRLCRYWPRGIPTTDIVEQVEEAHGSFYVMKKDSSSVKIFTCAYRDKKVKAFILSCGTTKLAGSGGNQVTIQRPAVVDEYETHKSSVDAANNIRDNLISYHDIISTERW